MNATLRRFIASITLAILTTVPTYAGCFPDNCLGPCTYEELLVDTTFNSNCTEWKWTGSAHRITVGSNGLAELPGSGSVYQTVSTNSYASMSVAFDVAISGTTSGTERLYVEILRGFTILETVEVFYPNDASGTYNLPIGNYSNETNLKMRFRYVSGTAPGNTVYRIDVAGMFGSFI